MPVIEATIVEDLAAVRRRTLDLVAHLDTTDLERQLDPILSPLVWDLAHIAAYEDLWLVHRHAETLAYLDAVRERTLATLERCGPDPVLHEMVLRHELQHTETMRQALAIGGLLPPGDPPSAP